MTLVGTNVPMTGALAKVTGAMSYIANLEFPGQLFAKALRSPYPHAKLLRIDARKAAALPGVRAIVTRDDLTGINPYFGTGVEDQPVVAIDRVRYVGDTVAAVAADSREIAEEAIALIDVEYEELSAVTDILEAAKSGAPIIHEQHVDKAAGGNIHGVYRAASGDIEQGFKESDEVIENTYSLPPVQHGHIEPHAVTAYWEGGGKLVVHSPCQTPSPLQEQLAKVFKLPLNRVRVIVPPVGGGYGGKNHARIEPVVALLARKARRPVQWILTREEVFLTGRRFGAVIKIKTGFKRDGRLWARKVEAHYDMGAYALSGPANTKNACIIAGGPYNIPHRDYTTCAVYTNLPPAGPYRGVGASHVCWAYESEMDEIARRLNVDPVELRLKNLIKEGDRFITGEPMISVGVSECLRQAAQAIGWRDHQEQAPRTARPIARRQRRRRRYQEYIDAQHICSQRPPECGRLGDLVDEQRRDRPGRAYFSRSDRRRRARPALRSSDRDFSRYRCDALRQIDQLQPHDVSHGPRRADRGWPDTRSIAASRRQSAGSTNRRFGIARPALAGQRRA